MDKWIRKVLLCLDWRNMSGTGRLESQEWEHLGSEGGEGGIEGAQDKDWRSNVGDCKQSCTGGH